MAFKIGSVTVVPVPTSSDASRGSYLVSDGVGGAFWGYMGNGATAGVVDNAQWRYRSIYTHGYLAAGYKGSNPWRSVNKTWHSTDTTMYCGEQIAYTQAYTNGNWSDYNAYIIANGGFGAQGSIICSYSLHNGTIRMFTADGWGSSGVSYGYVGNDPKNEGLSYGSPGFSGNVGGMRMNTTHYDPPATQDIKGQSGWISGGGSVQTERLHFPTETMYSGWNGIYDGIGDAAAGENKGWFSHGNSYSNVTWSNSTWTAGGWGSWSRDGHTKAQSTKWGHHYIGTGTNVTIGKAKFSDSTGATISTFNKVRSYGEENVEDGQDWGYILGHYDGQQNNHTIKQVHSTDSEVTLGAGAMPKGHYGQSSGCCSTGAATICVGGVI
jgi:hypothetical protein